MIPAIILSAGASKRMGFPKALLKIGKKTLLQDQIERLWKAGCEPVVVVAGSNARAVIASLKDEAISRTQLPKGDCHATSRLAMTHFIINKSWERGQFSSIKCGLRSLKNLSNGCLILPVDVPFVPVSLVKRIIKAAHKHRFAAIIPQFTSHGHPVFLSPTLIKTVLKTNTKTGRLDIILKKSKSVYFLKTNSKAILNNINTQEETALVKRLKHACDMKHLT